METTAVHVVNSTTDFAGTMKERMFETVVMETLTARAARDLVDGSDNAVPDFGSSTLWIDGERKAT